MGTPEAMYREDGEAVWKCELNSYGKVRKFQGKYVSDCPFRYQGQYEDAETGLYYNWFRYYDPESGNYISQDPIGLAGNNPTFYGYVKDPNSWVDVFGLKSNSQILSDNLGQGDIGHDAHHIVMAGSNDTRMVELRDKMNGYGIDKNDKENGIWLPRDESYRIDDRTLHKGEGLHSDNYKQYVYDKLIDTESKDEFLSKLENIKMN